nr:MAG TPA: hypothetical protein [Bacteriophage sp.]
MPYGNYKAIRLWKILVNTGNFIRCSGVTFQNTVVFIFIFLYNVWYSSVIHYTS